MPDTRRTPSRGPRRDARGGPGRRPTTAGRSTVSRTPRPAEKKAPERRPASAASVAAAGRGRGPAAAAPSHRPRLTGRAAILVLVVAVLAVSYASSLRAYLQQRGQIGGLQSQIADRQARIDSLESEKKRFDDPAYLEVRARLLGYVMPGETPYSVLQNGAPLAAGSTLGDPSTIAQTPPPTWYDEAWASMEVAGHPPTKPDPIPATKIEGH